MSAEIGCLPATRQLHVRFHPATTNEFKNLKKSKLFDFWLSLRIFEILKKYEQ